MKFYTYIYLDPRKSGKYVYGDYSFDYEPFYVGKGKDNRYNIHLTEAKSNLNYLKNNHKKNKIRKMLREDIQPIILKVEENLTEDQSFELEIYLIWAIGRSDLGLGPLCNHTDGGEGDCGRIVSEETRKMISDAKKGKYSDEKNHFYGKKHSEETRKKQSDSKKGCIPWNKGISRTKEEKKKMSESSIGQIPWNKGLKNPYSEKTKQKMSESHKGHIPWNKGKKGFVVSEETRKKLYSQYHIIFPDGHEEIILGLKPFCKITNLNYGSVKSAIRHNKIYEGYIINKITKINENKSKTGNIVYENA